MDPRYEDKNVGNDGAEYSLIIEKQKEVRKLTSKESYLVFAAFFGCGLSCLLLWNCMLSILPSLLEVLYPSLGSFTDTVTATYFTATCVFTLLLTFYPITRVDQFMSAIVALTILCVAFMMICIYSPLEYVSLFCHLYGGAVGFFVSIVLNGGYSLASTIPHPCISTISTGMGFSGLFTAAVWFLFSRAIFVTKSVENTVVSVVILMGTAALFNLGTLIIFSKFTRMEWLCDLFGKDYETVKHKWVVNWNFKEISHRTKTDEAVLIYKKLGYLGVAKKTYQGLLVRCLVFFQTLLVFPTIIPLSLRDVLIIQEVVTLIFQVGDCLGRYLTYITPKVNMNEKWLLVCVLIRIIFVVLPILCMVYYQDPFFHNAVFHCLLMVVIAVSNGLLSTVAAIHIPTHVEGPVAKTVAASLGLTTCFWGVAGGQWGAKLIKMLIENAQAS